MYKILQGKLEKVLLRAEQKPALQEAIRKVEEFTIKMIEKSLHGQL